MSPKRASVIAAVLLAAFAIWANSIRWHALGSPPGTYGVTVMLPCLSIEYSYWIDHRRLDVTYSRKWQMGGMSSNRLWRSDW